MLPVMRTNNLSLPVYKNVLSFVNTFVDELVAFIKMLQQKFRFIIVNGKYFMCESLNQTGKIPKKSEISPLGNGACKMAPPNIQTQR
jgi:hypothetical protein